MSSAEDLLDRAADADSLGAIARQGIGGFMLAVATAFISGVLTIGELVTRPIDAMAGAVSMLVSAIFTLPIDILEAAAESTAQSLLGPWAVGPLTWTFGVASVLASMVLVNWYIGLDMTGNITGLIPFDINWRLIPFVTGPEEERD